MKQLNNSNLTTRLRWNFKSMSTAELIGIPVISHLEYLIHLHSFFLKMKIIISIFPEKVSIYKEKQAYKIVWFAKFQKQNILGHLFYSSGSQKLGNCRMEAQALFPDSILHTRQEKRNYPKDKPAQTTGPSLWLRYCNLWKQSTVAPFFLAGWACSGSGVLA